MENADHANAFHSLPAEGLGGDLSEAVPSTLGVPSKTPGDHALVQGGSPHEIPRWTIMSFCPGPLATRVSKPEQAQRQRLLHTSLGCNCVSWGKQGCKPSASQDRTFRKRSGVLLYGLLTY